MTQGGPLLAKLFNIMVNAVVKSGLKGEELDELIETLFAIFYVDDPYVASRDLVFLQRAIDVLVAFSYRSTVQW